MLPAVKIGAPDAGYTFNGAIGLVPDATLGPDSPDGDPNAGVVGGGLNRRSTATSTRA